MALLAAGRLVERDTTIRWVVRCLDIYNELLSLAPEERAAFEQAKRVDVETWIVKLCSIATVLEGERIPGVSDDPSSAPERARHPFREGSHRYHPLARSEL